MGSNRTDKSKKTTYVATNGLFFKIGSTDRSVEKRESEFRTGNPDIKMLTSTTRDKVSEAELHYIFANYRQSKRAEWFCLNESSKDLLFKLCVEGLTKQQRTIVNLGISSGRRTETDHYWEFYLGSSLAPLEYTSKVVCDWMNYIFRFGPYEERKLTSMNSEQELLYCQQLADIDLPTDANRLRKQYPSFQFKIDGKGPVIPLKGILSCRWWLGLKIRESKVVTEFIKKRYHDFDLELPENSPKLQTLFGFASKNAVEAKISKVQDNYSF